MNRKTRSARPILSGALVAVGLVVILFFALTSMALAAPPRPNSVIDVNLFDLGQPAAPMGKSTIGDYVWHDTNADGIQDVGETGINGVLINLYLDTGDEIPQPSELIGSMVTGDNPNTPEIETGWYDFEVTADGNTYIVEIDPSNFAPGGALYGYVATGWPTYGPSPTVVYMPDLIMDISDVDFGYALAQINVVKSSTTTVITTAGQVVPYTFTVTNPGEVTLTGVTVTDPNCNAAPVRVSGDANSDNKLQKTETWTYTCSHTVTQAEIDTDGGGDGDLDNTVTADSIESAPDTDIHAIPIRYDPLIHVVKSSTTTVITTAGQVVPYRFEVTNIGNVTLTGITVTDANCNTAPAYQSGDTNTDNKLQTTETWIYTCSHTVTQAEIDTNGGGDGDLDNTVTADSYESAPDTDDHFIPITYNPLINVVKSSTTTVITTAGQVVPYTFVVTNVGNVTLTGITVTDPKCNAAPAYQSGDTNTDSKLQLTETWTYTCNHTVTQAEIDAGGNLTNTVTADSVESPPDTDTHNIPITQNPALNVVKSSTTTLITTAGQVVPYTFVVTNVGNMTLTGITVTDPNCNAAPAYQSGDTNSDLKLQLTETWTYTCSHTVTQAEIDSNGGGDGDLDNTVTADSNESEPDTDVHAIPITYNPLINVVKSSTTTVITTAGQVVPYTFVVTNIGNVTLTGITVTDPKCNAAPAYVSGDANSDNKLQLTETWTYTCNHTVTQAEIDAGGNLTNTVTADSIESPPDTDTHNIPITQNPALNVVKSSTTTLITTAGQVVPYTFVVTNVGNMTLTGITVTDPNCNAAPVRVSGDTNTDNKLQTTETWTYTCSHTVTQAEIDSNGGGDGDLDNTVTADSNETAPDTDVYAIPITYNPLINVVKSSTTTVITTAGQVVPYTFVVTNIGNVTLTGITVTDPKCDAAPAYQSGDTNSDSKLQITETWTYTCNHTVTQVEINAGGNLTNTVTADSVESPPDTDTHNIPITYNPLINVVKSSTTTVITTAGQVVPYTFVVTNVGNVVLTGITVTDPKCNATPAYQSGDTNSDSKLQLTETWTYTCNHTVTQAEIDAGGNLTNTVTADSIESPPDTDTHNIPITQNPLINVVKSSTTTVITAVGQVVPYTFVVTNVGNMTLTGITVTDPNCTSAISGPAGDTNSDGKLQLTETWTYTCTHTVTQAELDSNGGGDGDLDNTVTADSNESGPDTDSYAILIRSSIGDRVWWDVNGNGVQDAGEPGIPGVDITLFGHPTDTTDGGGIYAFDNLPTGSYIPTIPAAEFQPGGTLYGFSPTTPFQGGNPATDSNGVSDGAGGVQATVNLPAGFANLTIDFGFVKPTSYTLSKTTVTNSPVTPGEPVQFHIQIHNTGATYISVLPLVDTFDPLYLQFVSATPTMPDLVVGGTMTWNDLTGAGMLAPDSFFDVFVNFVALADTTALPPNGETINHATVPQQNTRVDPDGPGGIPEAVPPVPDLTSQDGIMIIQPTGVTLVSAAATATADGTQITWETADESQILGFNVLRDGVAVNAELILASATGTNSGAAYSYLDAGAGAYALEVVKLDGTVELIVLE